MSSRAREYPGTMGPYSGALRSDPSPPPQPPARQGRQGQQRGHQALVKDFNPHSPPPSSIKSLMWSLM